MSAQLFILGYLIVGIINEMTFIRALDLVMRKKGIDDPIEVALIMSIAVLLWPVVMYWRYEHFKTYVRRRHR